MDKCMLIENKFACFYALAKDIFLSQLLLLSKTVYVLLISLSIYDLLRTWYCLQKFLFKTLTGFFIDTDEDLQISLTKGRPLQSFLDFKYGALEIHAFVIDWKEDFISFIVGRKLH